MAKYTMEKQVSISEVVAGISTGYAKESLKVEKLDDQTAAIQRILDLMNAAIDKGWELQGAGFHFVIKDTARESKMLHVYVDKKYF